MNEFFDANKTFLLVLFALVGAMILMGMGKIPEVVTVVEFTTMAGSLIGIYAAKSVGGKFAKKKEG